MRYAISYDLNNPGQTYDRVIGALRSVGAQRILYSEWVVRWNGASAQSIREWMRAHIDANDRVMVTCLDRSDWAGWNLMTDPNTV